MRTKKTIFSKIVLSILAISMMVSLAACGKAPAPKEALSGKYVMSTMEVEGQTLEIQALEGIFDDIPNNFYVEFKPDGGVTINFDGEGGTGTYQNENGTVKITMEGDEETMTINGDVLSWDVDDALITFKKQ